MRKIINAGDPIEIIHFDPAIRTLLLQASNVNVGTIYLGFSKDQAIAGDCAWELNAGDWLILDDYIGYIWASADKDGQILNGGWYTRFQPMDITLRRR